MSSDSFILFLCLIYYNFSYQTQNLSNSQSKIVSGIDDVL